MATRLSRAVVSFLSVLALFSSICVMGVCVRRLAMGLMDGIFLADALMLLIITCVALMVVVGSAALVVRVVEHGRD